MKICAIICEYNPLHNGHVEHIKQSKAISGCDTLLLLMSGNFVQRGEPAMINKFDRAELAISAGADIVLELPTVHALSSAEKFAAGAMKILSSIPSVTSLSFGSEHGDLDTIVSLAKFLHQEPEDYKKILKTQLGLGLSPASSKTAAILECIRTGTYQVKNKDLTIESICSPNSILAIEYIRAILQCKSDIQPITIKRLGAGYNDPRVHDIFSSATAIRQSFNGGDLEEIENRVPAFVFEFLKKQKETNTLSSHSLSSMIMYKIRSMTTEEIGDLYDVNEGLENRIKKYARFSSNYLDLINAIKTKRYTHARLRRIFMYSLLGITEKLIQKCEKIPPYTRVLALKKDRQDVLSELSKTRINVLSRKEDYTQILASQSACSVQIDMLASDIYALLNSDPSLVLGGQDLSKGVLLV